MNIESREREVQPNRADPKRADRKGDAALLAGKRLVSLPTAEKYLGIGERQRAKLTRSGVLVTEGRGLSRKITTDSINAYASRRKRKLR